MFIRALCVVLSLACLSLRAADSVLNPPQIAAGTEQSLSDFAVDSTGAQYIVGTINTTVDLNPGVGDVSRTPTGGSGTDAYIIKLNADGGFAWGHTFGGMSSETGDAVVLSGGFVYMAGTTASSDAGFDGVAGTSGTGAFICAFDTTTGLPKGDFDGDGHAEYADFAGSTGPKLTFFGSALYLGGSGTSGGAQIAKISASTGALDLNFSTDGLQTFGGGTSFLTLNGVAADATRVYMAGTFSGTGAGVGAGGSIDSAGGNDGFVVGLSLTDGSADTNFSGNGVLTFGGTSSDEIQSLSLSNGTLFIGGIISSTDAGFDGAGALSRTAAQPDAVVIALDSAGTPLTAFDGDGVLVLSPPVASGAQEGSVQRVRIAAEFGAGVATPGIAIQVTQNPSNGISFQVVVGDFDGTGSKRVAFGINGEIKFDSNGSEIGQAVVRSNGRTSIAAIGSNSSSIPVFFTNNYIPRVLETRARVVASFTSDTGAPLFPHFVDVFPRADDVAGGRIVSVLGANFPGGASVTIADINMAGLTPVSSSKITGTVPAIAVTGDKTVALTFANGRVISNPNAFAIGTKAQAAGPVHRGPVNDAFVDSDNNTYFVGTFSGTKDFNPGSGVDMQRSVRNDTSAFVTKTNADGSYGWTSVFVGLGRTTLNSVVVKGNRVYAVGDFQPDTLTGTGQSFAGINGLGNALCKGNGDGALICLDRATGFAIDTVSNDGIKIVGGSTDTSFTFGTYDALHCIAVSPTANVLAVGGRMLSTDVGFDGAGAINANDSAFFFNVDTDCNVTQSVVKDYPLTPPSSSVPSALCTYTPDGAKLTCAAFSGDQIDLYQFSGNVGTPVNTFGTAGTKSVDAGDTVSRLSLDSTTELVNFAWITQSQTATVTNADGTTGLLASILNIESKPGQTPAGSVSDVTVAFDPVTDVCVVAVVCNGDLTLTSGAATQDLSVERTDQFDNNIVILTGDITNPQALATSAQVIKSDGGGSEDAKALVATPTGVAAVVATSAPGTTVRSGTQEVTPGDFLGAVLAVTGNGGDGLIAPTITSPESNNIVQGEEFVYTMTADGSPTITFTNAAPTFTQGLLTTLQYPGVVINRFGDDDYSSVFKVVRTGNQLRIRSELSNCTFQIKVKAENGKGEDEKPISFKVAPNPKAPILTVGFPTGPFDATEVNVGNVEVPYSVTGDLPITVTSGLQKGEDAVSDFTSTPADFVTATLPSPGSFAIHLLAKNAFGSDFKIVNLDAGNDADRDFDNDGTPNGLDPDDDGDGFPDFVEEALSDPRNPSSTPGSGIVAEDALVTVNKATSVSLTQGSENDSLKDSCLGEGFIVDFRQSRAAPKPVPGTLLYNFGGVSRIFTIDAKGKGVSGNDTVSVKLKSVKGVMTGTISVSLKKGDFKAALTDEGLTDRDAKKETVTVNSFIAYNNVFMNRTLTLEYSSKLGKKGSAKLKK